MRADLRARHRGVGSVFGGVAASAAGKGRLSGVRKRRVCGVCRKEPVSRLSIQRTTVSDPPGFCESSQVGSWVELCASSRELPVKSVWGRFWPQHRPTNLRSKSSICDPANGRPFHSRSVWIYPARLGSPLLRPPAFPPPVWRLWPAGLHPPELQGTGCPAALSQSTTGAGDGVWPDDFSQSGSGTAGLIGFRRSRGRFGFSFQLRDEPIR